MSFRSVSALPKCLHGRLAPRRAVLFRSFTTCPRCLGNFSQTASAINNESVNYVPHAQLDDGSSSPIVRFSEQRKRLDRSTYQFRTVKIKTRNDTAGSTPGLQGKSRIGSILQVPSFIHHDPDAPVHTVSKAEIDDLVTNKRVPARHVRRDDEHSIYRSIKLDPSDVGYKQWEELHDKFIESQRTAPHRTAEVFVKERKIARRFVGDTTNIEVSAIEFDCKWLALSSKEQEQLLPIILLGSLVESARQTLFVLANVGWIPTSFRVRMNCLRHLGIMYWADIQQDPELKQAYAAMIGRLRSPEYWPKNRMPAVLLQVLLLWSTPEQCQKIIRDVIERYPDAQASYTKTMIDHYLRIKDQQQAFDHFKQLPEDIMLQPDSIAKALRDRLIKQDVVVRSDDGTNFKYLPQLLALGIPPDEALHNTVIESALINGLPDVAWDVYQYLEGSKFQTSSRSHLILLQDAFRRGDLQKVNEIMTAIHKRDDLVKDEFLVAYSMNIVRNIRCYDHQLGTEEARSHIMALYDRAHDRAPLIRLGIAQSSEGLSSLPLPSPTLLAFTIWTCILIQHQDRDVLRLWQWIKYLISQGDPEVSAAARHDIIYNGLILYHARRATNLPHTLDVVQFMLSSKLCLPTSKTWSMLLCAFLKHGRIEEAQKIINLMHEKGFNVQAIHELYGNDLRPGKDLRSLADRAVEGLNEEEIPEELAGLLAESPSLQREEKYLTV